MAADPKKCCPEDQACCDAMCNATMTIMTACAKSCRENYPDCPCHIAFAEALDAAVEKAQACADNDDG